MNARTAVTGHRDTVDGALVVLLDEAGNAVGTAPKQSVHGANTPLHLAFSCYVFDTDGRFLLTRRATGKRTWPGAWTNSFCGHPGPGEDIWEAVRRRAGQELGVELRDLGLALPGFRYRAVMANGMQENEMCPVFVAVTEAEVRPDRLEVDSFEWVNWPAFRADVLAGRRKISPWCASQVAELPGQISSVHLDEGDRTQLPAAARHRPVEPTAVSFGASAPGHRRE
ncbi:MAG: isopentenyl-diphosphate Delta-isomerase [Actinomycetota bacterium]|nr:isopentenyl-diphosphate Delta-isomerase [Actinomycetota bacterium]